jgi:hypothetical protein
LVLQVSCHCDSPGKAAACRVQQLISVQKLELQETQLQAAQMIQQERAHMPKKPGLKA